MRRPLFGNGIPVSLTDDEGQVTVLDTSELDPLLVYALTLYVWPWEAGGAGDPSVRVRLISSGVTKLIALYGPLFWADYLANDLVVEPLCVLKDFMMRGDQQVTVDNTIAVPSTVFLYGYFEVVGEQAPSLPFRPLQPAALEAPFNAPDNCMSLAGGVATTLHQLSEKYIDRLIVDAVVGAGTAEVALPGGVVMPLPTSATQGQIHLFDGIPMRAPSAGDNLITFEAAGGEAVATSAWGSFYRY